MNAGHKWFGMKSKRRRDKANLTQRTFRRSRIETLEVRQVLSNIVPTLVDIDDVTLYQLSPLHIPLDAADVDGDSLGFSVSITNNNVTGGSIGTEVLDGNRSMKIDTNYGDMLFELFEGRAPRVTERIIMLAESGLYDGLIFHRVIDGFMIQGGDPLGDGSGGSDLPDFDDQFHVDLQHNGNGVLSMAKSGDDTNNSQFFITEGPTRHLDFNHSIFGQLTEGEDVRETISNVPVTGSTPDTPVVMESVEIFYDNENGVLVLKAPEGAVGTADITVTVDDGNGGTASRTFTVTVEPDVTPGLPPNNPEGLNGNPFLADVDPIVTTQNDPTSITLQALDVDGEMIIYDGTGGSFTLPTRFMDEELVNYYIPGNLPLTSHTDLDYEVDQVTGDLLVTPTNDLVGVHPIFISVSPWYYEGGNDNPVIDWDTQLVPVVIQPDTLTAESVLEMSIVQTPTATDAYGEIDQLPDNVDWMDEWESFSVEIWASTENNPDQFGIHTAAFDLTYNTDYYTATGIEYGNMFSSNRTGLIDDNAGEVRNIGGRTPMYTLNEDYLPHPTLEDVYYREDPHNIEKFGDDKRVLVARVNFQPNATGAGVPMNSNGGYVTPVTDLGLSIENAAVALNVGDPAAITVADAPQVDVWPMMYDNNDNGEVGLGDLSFFAAAYGTSVGQMPDELAWMMDYDRTGDVGLGDLSYFAANYHHSVAGGEVTSYPAGFPENWLPPATSATSQTMAVFENEPAQGLDNDNSPDNLSDDPLTESQLAHALYQSQNDSGSDNRSTDETAAIVDLLMRVEGF